MELAPIHEAEVEKTYLGNILIEGKKVISKDIFPEDFYVPLHRKVYRIILTLKNKGEVIDPIMVGREDRSILPEISKLVDSALAPSNNNAYAKLILEASKKRRLQGFALDLIKQVQETESIDDLADHAVSEISNISASTAGVEHGLDSDDILTSIDLGFFYNEHIENLKRGGMKLAIPELDKYIRRVAKGEVLTIIARPGCFKTALLQHIMLSYNRKSEVCVFFSLEMPPAGIYERFAQAILGKSGSEFETAWKNNLITQEDIKKINYEMEGIYIIPTRPTLAQMKYYCNRVARKAKKPVGLIGIDYLGLVSDAGRTEYERNSKIATDVKVFAKQQNVSVVLLSQLNRTGGDGTTPVTIDMARGSGQIEEAADYIIGLHRVNKEVFAGRTDIGASILKNRTGPVGDMVAFGVYPETMRFAGIDFSVDKPKDDFFDVF